MKKLAVGLLFLFICTFAIAQTISIDWKVGGNTYAQNTCEYGGTLTVPSTPPTKYGYTFQGWGKYVQLEYIESTGMQYIDTGYIPNDNTRMEIVYKTTAIDISRCGATPIGGRVAYNNKQFNIFSPVNTLTMNYICFANSCFTVGFESINKEMTGIIDIPNNYVAFKTKNQEYTRESNSYIPRVEYEQPLYLFNNNNNGHAGTCDGTRIQIMSVQLSENGDLIHDFIPVLDSNGVACMYDKETKQFYYNLGTGDFVPGPVVQQ